MRLPYLHCGFFIPETNTFISDCALTQVHAKASIIDYVSEVEITQKYHNCSVSQTLNASYVFPLPPQAAVVGFRAVVNGREVIAVVKEKQQAKQEFREAVARGDGAYLMEQGNSDDIFSIKIGNLPPSCDVDIIITYIAEISYNDTTGCEFVLPLTVAPRYSPYEPSPYWKTRWNGWCILPSPPTPPSRSIVYQNKPVSNPSRYTNLPEYLFDAEVIISTSSQQTIASVSSPSHGTPSSSSSSSSESNINFSTSSPSLSRVFLSGVPLDRDFVINIAHNTIDNTPSVVIETCDLNQRNNMTQSISAPLTPLLSHAAMITFVPKFDFIEDYCEFVFIVDRSGSMSGSKMEKVIEAMQVFLRSLPNNCFFNIVSFGSSYSSLFPTSQPYSQSTFSTASSHIAGMSANMGGTELMQPINDVLNKPVVQNGYKRKLFVLTDGQVTNIESINSTIASAVKSKNARVFSLGIGNDVSHALVEGMARSGRGRSEFVMEVNNSSSDSVTSKVMLLLKNALQPSLEDVSLRWHYTHNLVDGNNSTDQHFGITCDSCSQTPLLGRRFKCSVRPDYDLCYTCLSRLPSLQPSQVTSSSPPHREQFMEVFLSPQQKQQQLQQQQQQQQQRSVGNNSLFGGFIAPSGPPPAPAAAPSVTSSFFYTSVVLSPATLPPIFSGSKYTVFCFFPLSSTLPTAVTVTAKQPSKPGVTSNSGLNAVISLVGPGAASSLTAGWVVHRMGVRKLLRELDDVVNSKTTHWCYNNKNNLAKLELIRLSCLYNVLSSQTAFLAVERRSEAERQRIRMMSSQTQAVPSTQPSSSSFHQPNLFGGAFGAVQSTSLFGGFGSNNSNSSNNNNVNISNNNNYNNSSNANLDDQEYFELPQQLFQPPPPQQEAQFRFQSASIGAAGGSFRSKAAPAAAFAAPPTAAFAAPPTAAFASAPSSSVTRMSSSSNRLQQSMEMACAAPPPSSSSSSSSFFGFGDVLSFGGTSAQKNSSERKKSSRREENEQADDMDMCFATTSVMNAPAQPQQQRPTSKRELMKALMMRQSFDGGYNLSLNELATLLGLSLLALQSSGGSVEEKKWVVALVVALHQKYLIDLKSEWEFMISKATSTLGSSSSSLVQNAAASLAAAQFSI